MLLIHILLFFVNISDSGIQRLNRGVGPRGIDHVDLSPGRFVGTFHRKLLVFTVITCRFNYSSTCIGRPPAVCGHLIDVPTHFNVTNYLQSADTCLTWTQTVIYWLSAPAITDSANKCHVFDGRFHPKSLSRIPTCD